LGLIEQAKKPHSDKTTYHDLALPRTNPVTASWYKVSEKGRYAHIRCHYLLYCFSALYFCLEVYSAIYPGSQFEDKWEKGVRLELE